MQDIHYFQRYSQPENVVTNNTLLLLSRLYHHSSQKFSLLLSSLFEDCDIESGIKFHQQRKSLNSVPDGEISQQSFKILIETKLGDNFSIDQLINHCKSFSFEETKILLSLSPVDIKNKNEIVKKIHAFIKMNKINIYYQHVKFSELIDNIRKVLDHSDYIFEEILNDYTAYAFESGLIDDSQFWMRAVTCGQSFEDNFKYDLYYDPSDRGFSAHGYIGVYYQKAVRGIGRLVNVVQADYIDRKLVINRTNSPVTDNQKERIINAMKDAAENREWNIYKGHQFFLVDKFERTNFLKKTKYPIQRTKYFDLCEVLNLDKLPETTQIAELLNDCEW